MLKHILSFIVLSIGFLFVTATLLLAQYYSWHCPQWLLSNNGEETSIAFGLVVILTLCFEIISCIGTIFIIQDTK